ncbi:hypothetical protein BOTBODRAFT_32856 [Botryobasidium botryosum FD-172 SS1]|uniref:NmrA-like domain-containing protein n=1 Tax=Botryobasidium botryosum (strain FD-172 SS1) TaxID=930990 RepID=A0A067MS64_BOTB1|nr:hypothetical protein BOTBODRAFT_32856 [Botryobasidium botryosum FD-172 SS1]
MSTKYTSFAVIGAGNVGVPIVQNLLSRGASVVVLTRLGSSTNSKLPSGAKVVAVDSTSAEAYAAAFREHEVQVAISTVGSSATMAQYPMADGAKLAGVELFVASEFGSSTLGATSGHGGAKEAFARHLAEIGLPSVRIFGGALMHYIPGLVELQSGKFRIVGKGETKISFTAIEDIAGFTAHVLTTLPPSELKDAIFRIQGECVTLREVADMYGDTVQVEYVESLSNEFVTMVQRGMNAGAGATGGTSNDLWEGHQWKGIKEVLKIA